MPLFDVVSFGIVHDIKIELYLVWQDCDRTRRIAQNSLWTGISTEIVGTQIYLRGVVVVVVNSCGSTEFRRLFAMRKFKLNS